MWNGNPYFHLVNRNTQTRITLNQEDLDLISRKTNFLKDKALSLDVKKTSAFKRKMDKKSQAEKHTDEDKKKRKSSHEREEHSHDEDNSTSSETVSDY